MKPEPKSKTPPKAPKVPGKVSMRHGPVPMTPKSTAELEAAHNAFLKAHPDIKAYWSWKLRGRVNKAQDKKKW